MAYPDNLTDSPEDRAIRDFFTFRPGQPDYVDGPFPTRKDQWSWLEIYPQHGYIKGPDGGSNKFRSAWPRTPLPTAKDTAEPST